jgi:hypothetical protein
MNTTGLLLSFSLKMITLAMASGCPSDTSFPVSFWPKTLLLISKSNHGKKSRIMQFNLQIETCLEKTPLIVHLMPDQAITCSQSGYD